jgi:hypothetical protein
MTEKFKVYAVAEDDSKSVVDAKELIIDFGNDKELRIFLRNYNGQGALTLLSDRSNIVLRPGGGNLLRILLEPEPPRGNTCT